MDPLAGKYPSLSAYSYVANNPVNAFDPDGRRIFWVGGAGNDQAGWNYTKRWRRSFTNAGIRGFTRLNVSHDNPVALRNGALPGDIRFTSAFRGSRYKTLTATHNEGQVYRFRRRDKMVNKAVSDIKANLSANPLGEGEQLNLAGYSYGAVLQSHAALALADEGTNIDNLILIGSPTHSSSDLFNEVSNHENIGNVIRIDISGDLLSNSNNLEYIFGAIQNVKDDGPHFDLARPGKEVDQLIIQAVEFLRELGVR